MKVYVLFSREGPQKKGGQGNCLICLTQYPPLIMTFSRPFYALIAILNLTTIECDEVSLWLNF